jgi:hypothetical protein
MRAFRIGAAFDADDRQSADGNDEGIASMRSRDRIRNNPLQDRSHFSCCVTAQGPLWIRSLSTFSFFQTGRPQPSRSFCCAKTAR